MPPDERDAEMLGFVADHRVVLPSQLVALTGLSADTVHRRLRRLEHAGFVRHEPLLRAFPAARLITPAGLRALGRKPSRSEFRRREAVHDVGAGWLWLAARGGAFGPLRAVHTERALRALDGLPQLSGRAGDGPRGVRQFAVGPGGRERLHYPDLELEISSGQRVALELELTGKSDRRLEQILGSYAADPRLSAVLYVVADDRIEAQLRRVARRSGASGKLIIRRCGLSTEMERLAAGTNHSMSRGRARSAGRSNAPARETER